MQCKHRHFIYTIDKKRIEEDYQLFCKKKILNVRAIEQLGNGIWWVGVEKFCTGKWWVYYDRSPRHSKHRLHRKLFEMGYFDYYETGCGKCEICQVEKSKEWSTKGYCESQIWQNSCFLTLTYNNLHLPADRKLRRSDIQKFWKEKLHSIPNHNNSTQDSNKTHPDTHTHTIFHYHIHNTFGNHLALGNIVHPLPLLGTLYHHYKHDQTRRTHYPPPQSLIRTPDKMQKILYFSYFPHLYRTKTNH